MFKAIMNLYRHGRITANGVAAAVAEGIITAKEYREITGEGYPGGGA